MLEPIWQALWLAVAVTMGGLSHVLAIRSGWLPRLARVRLDGGLTLRGRPLFGANKTLRGAVVMLGATGLWTAALDALSQRFLDATPLRTVSLQGLSAFPYGVLLGSGYILGELPNSLLKRQLDIQPGQASSRWRPVFWLLDQVDSTLGIILILACLGLLSWGLAAALLALTLIIHPSVALLMVALGLKRRVG